MRTITYWKTSHLGRGVPLTFHLVPTQTISEPHPFFDEIATAVRAAGFDYQITETKVTLLESGAAPPEADDE